MINIIFVLSINFCSFFMFGSRLQRDWCSSPVKMEKADERNYRKYQRLKLKSAFICFQFKKK